MAGRRASGAVFRRVVFFLAAAGFFASPDDDDRGRAPLDRARGFGAGASGTGGGDRAAPRRVARQSMSWRSTSALANLPLSWRDLAAETTLREPTFAHVALCYRETAEERAARGKPPMPGHLHLALYHDVPRCDPKP